jgi:hypothetical protein
MIGSRNTCTSCFGNGRCSQCDGSGLDPGSGEQRKCASCAGSGVCSACNGSGAWMQPPPEILDLGVRKGFASK